ncbi:MAG: His/Gly/Thr/Pro-type tRNA ligase C-terminal domain-containing protein [Xanthomonadales bacterium]
MGQERLIELMREHAEPEPLTPHVYLIMAGAGTASGGLQLAERLRDEVPLLRIQSNLANGSFKAQFKRADRSGAPLALVLGEDELAGGTVTVKYLREERPQEQVDQERLGGWLQAWMTAP